MAVSATAPATAQINARISSGLKSSGDAALAKAGFTPTQAVRALWSLADRHSSDPGELRRILLPEEAETNQKENENRRKRMLKQAEEGACIVQNAYAALGLSHSDSAENIPYDELKQLAYEEKYGTADGWL